jgi:hypothetical protein
MMITTALLRPLRPLLLLLLLLPEPLVSFSTNPWYYDHWCDNEGSVSLKYLDDSQCAKVFPSSFSRDWQCPNANAAAVNPPAGYEADSVPLAEAAVDTVSLEAAGVPTDVQLCLILVQRFDNASAAASSGGGGGGGGTTTTLYNKRFCSGGGEQTSFETWSSSKFLAMGNAAGKLREECGGDGDTNTAGGGCIGLDAVEAVEGASSSSSSSSFTSALLGDLATIVASYDTTQGLSSNAVSSYFHDLGTRQRAHDLLAQTWLALNPNVSGADAAAAASLGGNYGEASPASLGFSLATNTNSTTSRVNAPSSPSFSSSLDVNKEKEQKDEEESEDASATATCEATPDTPATTYANSLTALALAEAHRRLVLHREVAAPLKLPSAAWADAQVLLYGAGTTTDPAAPAFANAENQTTTTAFTSSSSSSVSSAVGTGGGGSGSSSNGAPLTSVLFGPAGVDFGGLTADPAIFLQSALDESLASSPSSSSSEAAGSGRGGSDSNGGGGNGGGGMAAMDAATGGRWRIFSKLGAGYSSSRSVGEIVTAGYGCVPAFDDDAGGSSGGFEFALAARASVPGDDLLVKAQERLYAAVSAAIGAMVTGTIA